jgi:hypothetical protein
MDGSTHIFVLFYIHNTYHSCFNPKGVIDACITL